MIDVIIKQNHPPTLKTSLNLTNDFLTSVSFDSENINNLVFTFETSATLFSNDDNERNEYSELSVQPLMNELDNLEDIISNTLFTSIIANQADIIDENITNNDIINADISPEIRLTVEEMDEQNFKIKPGKVVRMDLEGVEIAGKECYKLIESERKFFGKQEKFDFCYDLEDTIFTELSDEEIEPPCEDNQIDTNPWRRYKVKRRKNGTIRRQRSKLINSKSKSGNKKSCTNKTQKSCEKYFHPNAIYDPDTDSCLDPKFRACEEGIKTCVNACRCKEGTRDNGWTQDGVSYTIVGCKKEVFTGDLCEINRCDLISCDSDEECMVYNRRPTCFKAVNLVEINLNDSLALAENTNTDFCQDITCQNINEICFVLDTEDLPMTGCIPKLCSDSPSLNCGDNGLCIDRNSPQSEISDYRSCSCKMGYFGLNCQLDACSNIDCMNGVCEVNNSGQAECICDAGWGKNEDYGLSSMCSEDIDECLGNDNPCQNRGICRNLNIKADNQPFECDCLPSYYNHGTDKSCFSTFDDCATGMDYCGGNGICISQDRQISNVPEYICDCDLGYEFSLEMKTCLPVVHICQKDDNTCQNNGLCLPDGPGEDYLCECAKGFEGNNCELDINECDITINQNTDLCGEFGSCENLPGTYQCNCINNYRGANCEIEPMFIVEVPITLVLQKVCTDEEQGEIASLVQAEIQKYSKIEFFNELPIIKVDCEKMKVDLKAIFNVPYSSFEEIPLKTVSSLQDVLQTDPNFGEKLQNMLDETNGTLGRRRKRRQTGDPSIIDPVTITDLIRILIVNENMICDDSGTLLNCEETTKMSDQNIFSAFEGFYQSNACENNPCGNNGICSIDLEGFNSINGYICQCYQGYSQGW